MHFENGNVIFQGTLLVTIKKVSFFNKAAPMWKLEGRYIYLPTSN